MEPKYRLVIFDLDGTLTEVASIWRYLHERLGTLDAAKRSAEKFRRGEIDYKTWAREDAQLWKGLDYDTISRMMDAIRYVKGAEEVIGSLKTAGIRVGIVSAGLSLLADRVMRELGTDFAMANELLFRNGMASGDVKVNVSLANKEEIIREMAFRTGCDLRSCVVIGDNVQDIPEEAGLRIAYNPTNVAVSNKADIVITGDLREILRYVLPDMG